VEYKVGAKIEVKYRMEYLPDLKNKKESLLYSGNDGLAHLGDASS
jgi:hypothetical protein